MKIRTARTLLPLALLSLLGMGGPAYATVIDFTGGTATLFNGSTVVTDTIGLWTDQVVSYEEDGFVFTFVGGYGTIGNYYAIGQRPDGTTLNNDVVHAHWASLASMTITAVDGSSFDLNYIDLASNTVVGGGQASGGELSYIANDAGYSMLLPSSDWGFDWDYFGQPGDGVARLYLDSNFDDVFSVTFTSMNAFCFGMDNFYINEPAPPPIPEPSTIALLGIGLLGLGLSRRRMS